jgi:hypothetical protein
LSSSCQTSSNLCSTCNPQILKLKPLTFSPQPQNLTLNPKP